MPGGKLPQYPDCKNAEIDRDHYWQETVDGVTHEIPMVRCKLMSKGYQRVNQRVKPELCISVNERDACPNPDARDQSI
jgi:hypothetical protein